MFRPSPNKVKTGLPTQGTKFPYPRDDCTPTHVMTLFYSCDDCLQPMWQLSVTHVTTSLLTIVTFGPRTSMTTFTLPTWRPSPIHVASGLPTHVTSAPLPTRRLSLTHLFTGTYHTTTVPYQRDDSPIPSWRLSPTYVTTFSFPCNDCSTYSRDNWSLIHTTTLPYLHNKVSLTHVTTDPPSTLTTMI